MRQEPPQEEILEDLPMEDGAAEESKDRGCHIGSMLRRCVDSHVAEDTISRHTNSRTCYRTAVCPASFDCS